MNKNIMWLAVVVALLVGIFLGFAFERSRATSKMETEKLLMQKQIDDVKMTNEKLLQENKQLQISPTPAPTGGAKKVTPTQSATQY